MAASRSTDVNLAIRAKNEASAGINQVALSIKALLGDNTAAAKSANELAAGLSSIDKISSKISTSASGASDAIGRQAKSLLSTRDGLDASKAKVDELTRALGLLQA